MKTTINIRIESKFKNQLEFLSNEQGIKTSAFVRTIIIEYLETYIDLDREEPFEVLFMNLTKESFDSNGKYIGDE